MVRKIVPFKRWHYGWLEVAKPNRYALHDSVLAQMEEANSYTGIVDGNVVFCAGTLAQWPTRHIGWALLHERLSRPHILWITREVRAGLECVKGRIEMTVRADFTQGQRWAKAIGFRVETPLLEAYGPDGEDHIGYVRVNQWL